MLKSIAKAIFPERFLSAVLHLWQHKKFRYNHHGLATVHNCDFITDTRFQRAYAAGVSTGSWGAVDLQWTAYIACWAADIGLRLEGDFVECGVNRGGLARTVLEFVDLPSSGKKFYLLDTFEGLLQRYISPEEERNGITPGGYAPCYDEVVSTFSPFRDCVVIVKGPVPASLSQAVPQKVSYLSIDMNCVEPEIAAAEFYWPRMVSGSIMLLDDYGWARHEAQKKAFDRFAQQRGVLVLSLPTGQGLIVKP
jgi:O-methyltransferase